MQRRIFTTSNMREADEPHDGPVDKCATFDCPAYIICVHAIGTLSPSRFQCSECGRNRIAMQDRRRVILSESTMHRLDLEPGCILHLSNNAEPLHVQEVTTRFSSRSNTMTSEVFGFSEGSLESQIEYEDADWCKDMVGRDKLTRLCRECCYRPLL